MIRLNRLWEGSTRFLSQARNAAHTGKEMLKAKIQSISSRATLSPELKRADFTRAIPALKERGRRLNNFQLQVAIEYLRKKSNNGEFNLISTFINANANTFSAEEMIELIQEQRKRNPSYSVVIPVVFGRTNSGEAHVAVIIATGNTIYYYDSKGITSDQRFLKDGKTLEYVLKNMKCHFEEERTIRENSLSQQKDIHNCGAFVLKCIDNFFVEGNVEAALNHDKKGESLQEYRDKLAERMKVDFIRTTRLNNNAGNPDTHNSGRDFLNEFLIV